MISKYKINNAKERISVLSEKYSKTTKKVRNILNSSSESDLSLKKQYDINKSEDQLEITEHPSPSLINQTITDMFGKVNERIHLQNPDSSLPDDPYNYDLLFEKYISEDLPEKSKSAGSTVVSDLSNQFERIRFISSSSEDISIVQSLQSKSQASSIASIKLPVAVNNNHLTKISDKNAETSLDEENTNKSAVDISIVQSLHSKSQALSIASITSIKPPVPVNENHLTEIIDKNADTGLHEENTSESVDKESIRSLLLPESDLESNMSSVKEVSSLSEIESIHEEINLDYNTDKTNYVSPKTNVNLKAVLKSSSPSIKYEFNVNNKPEQRNEVEKQDSIQNSSVVLSPPHEKSNFTKHCNYADKSTNTKPIKEFKMPFKHKHYKIKRSFNGQKEGHKNNYLKTHKPSVYIKHYLYVKPDTQPVIKPSKLISFDEIESDNLGADASMHGKCQSVQNDLYDDIFNKTELTCDDVIHELLKNQIKLTRHFIKSHHQMYLQVHKAAELLYQSRR